MEHRPVALGAGLVLLLATSALAMADEAALAAKRERAARLESEASALRKAAKQQYAADEAACRTSFFVNDCLRAAKDRRLEQIDVARHKEMEQATLEREVRYAELGDRRAKKAKQRAEHGPPATVVTPSEPVAPEVAAPGKR